MTLWTLVFSKIWIQLLILTSIKADLIAISFVFQTNTKVDGVYNKGLSLTNNAYPTETEVQMEEEYKDEGYITLVLKVLSGMCDGQFDGIQVCLHRYSFISLQSLFSLYFKNYTTCNNLILNVCLYSTMLAQNVKQKSNKPCLTKKIILACLNLFWQLLWNITYYTILINISHCSFYWSHFVQL